MNLGHGQQTNRPVRQPEIPGNLYLRPLSTELKTCNQTSVRLTPCYTILSHLDGFVPNRIACETDGIHFTVKCAVRFMHGSVRARARVTSPCGHVRECILCSHLHDKTLTQCDVDALASEWFSLRSASCQAGRDFRNDPSAFLTKMRRASRPTMQV